MVYRVQTAKSLAGEIEPPGDKSISHRAAMLGGLAQGTTIVDNFLHGEDTEATMNCLRSLGVEIHVEEPSPGSKGLKLTIAGRGREGFRESEQVLDVRNSGTTMRMMSGVLASLPFLSVLTGDASLVRRPMRRVIDPCGSWAPKSLAGTETDIRHWRFAVVGCGGLNTRCRWPVPR